MSQEKQIELKPCPFCGGEADLWWRHGRRGYFTVVVCSFCKASGKTIEFGEELPDNWENTNEVRRAENAWNRRAYDEQRKAD